MSVKLPLYKLIKITFYRDKVYRGAGMPGLILSE